MGSYLCAIDQGTTSSRAILFDLQGRAQASVQVEFAQHYPDNAWVEHNPEDIWQTVLASVRGVIEQANISAAEIIACGISNQRETTLLWDKHSGQPVYPAIVWQDRRTAAMCDALAQDQSLLERVQSKTGLLLDAYFSASKLSWILSNVDGARRRAENGDLLFGTVDSFLLWRLTAGAEHATDVTNAARTLLFNIHDLSWDAELLEIFNIPRAVLPEVKSNCESFGAVHSDLFGAAIPITAMAGDQQAAAFGQACFAVGDAKVTYGTGCFMLLNTEDKIIISKNKLLSTVAFQYRDKLSYALEGSIFIAGAAIQWLRDNLGIIENTQETADLAASINDNDGVYLVPAFTGLGAPYWDAQARGALLGLTRNSGVAHIVRAALEAVCYQSRDLLEAMQADGVGISTLRVDGGMAANNWLLQFLADILGCAVQRPQCIETSALGVAYMAGLGAGVYSSLDEVASLWQEDKIFIPAADNKKRQQLYDAWLLAVSKVLS